MPKGTTKLRLPEDSKVWSGGTAIASRSTTSSAIGVYIPHRRESNTHSSTRRTQLPLEDPSKSSDPFSDDAQITVVESGSDSADEADEMFSPDAMPVFNPSDQIFMVMGVTGAGKSTFISLLTEANVEVGHELQSNTKQVNFYELRGSSGKRALLIDTPGFDDSERENLDLLKELIACLTIVDQRGGRITGIFYLHRITDPRMGGSSIKSLTIFKLLVGAAAMPLVRLVSTRWNDIEGSTSELARAEALEKQLCTADKYWGTCLAQGALTLRHRGDQASAQAVVDSVLKNDVSSTTRLSIIQELRDRKLPLLETGVGRFLSEDTDKLARQYEADIENLKREQRAALQDKDHELAQQLAAEEREFRRRSERIAWVKRELSNDYMPPQASVARHPAPREPAERGEEAEAPPPPLHQRGSGCGDRMIADLNRRHKREQRALEVQLKHERRKNRKGKPRQSHGGQIHFLSFLKNGFGPY